MEALCAAARWLTKSKEFTPRQRTLSHYEIELAETGTAFDVHFVPLPTPEDADTAGGSSSSAKECTVSLRKTNLAIERVMYFK
jgi:hypothetical protein